MLIKELPGVYFREKVDYELSGEGSKIPIFIGKTGNQSYYDFISYDNSDNEIGRGNVKLTGLVEGEYSQVEVISNSTDSSYIGRQFYIKTNAKADGKTLNILYTDAGNTEAGIKVSVKGTYLTDGSCYMQFYKISNALNDVVPSGDKWEEQTGIGTYYNDDGEVVNEENELAKVLSEFYEESRLLQSTDIGVPYIYIIDVGTGEDVKAWEKALETAKTLTDATVEAYIGAENINGTTLKQLLIKAVDSIHNDTEELDLRYGFSTLNKDDGESLEEYDTRLINLANELRASYTDALYKLSRLGLCEDLLLGKTLARICCTPYNTEPGFLVYRSVEPNTFRKRLRENMLNLQSAGIIFNRDEQVNGVKYPRINLCVSSSFGSTTDRPADSLFHARFNADDLLREVFAVCYTQIKANESATNIAFLQTKINKLVSDRVSNEEMIKYDDRTEVGTKLTVMESDEEPYNLIVTGQIQPVKCTIAIRVEAIIKI